MPAVAVQFIMWFVHCEDDFVKETLEMMVAGCVLRVSPANNYSFVRPTWWEMTVLQAMQLESCMMIMTYWSVVGCRSGRDLLLWADRRKMVWETTLR